MIAAVVWAGLNASWCSMVLRRQQMYAGRRRFLCHLKAVDHVTLIQRRLKSIRLVEKEANVLG